jgi:hypothetical protein
MNQRARRMTIDCSGARASLDFMILNNDRILTKLLFDGFRDTASPLPRNRDARHGSHLASRPVASP